LVSYRGKAVRLLGTELRPKPTFHVSFHTKQRVFVKTDS
jgi:hypothetical protein